jgi:hypothetical protein
MTNFQQALLHLATVVVVLVAVSVLAITGHLSEEVLTVVLAVAGFTTVGIAGTTSTTSTAVVQPPVVAVDKTGVQT